MKEARIGINGTTLTVGQSMAVRMACTTFLMDMAEPNSLGDDEHGKRMAEGYRARLSEVISLLHAR